MKRRKHVNEVLSIGLVALIGVMGMANNAHAVPVLLGGFDGNQTQNTIAPASTTSNSGVRELVDAKQSTEAVGAVSARIWTDQTTNKELQWGATNPSTTDGKWGTSTFTPAASTANDPWVITQGGSSWINFEIANTGTVDVALDKFHISARRTSADAATTLTVSLEQNGTFADPPVLSNSDLTATGSQDIDITVHTVNTWGHYEFALSSILSDWTLAPGEMATFRITNTGGTGARLYLDNIAISGELDAPPPPPSEGGTVVVDAVVLRSADPVGSIQWQSSADSSTWSDVTDATAATLDVTGLYTDTPWFRVQTTSGTNAPAYSSTMKVTLSPDGTVLIVQ